MKIIPYEKYCFKCDLTTEQFVSKLQDNTESQKMFRFSGGSKLFQGNVYGNGFKIWRIISYRNSFLPQIKGEIVPAGENVDIRILNNSAHRSFNNSTVIHTLTPNICFYFLLYINNDAA